MLSDAIFETIKIETSAVRLTDMSLGYNEQDLSDTLKAIALEIGMRHITYLRFTRDKSSDTSLLTATVTYSREWTQRYFVKQYVHTDPVVTHGSNAVLPFDWETLANKDPAARAFFDDAANYGVGRNGLSIPVRNRRGIYALVSFSGEQSRAEWAQYKSENMAKAAAVVGPH